MDENIREDNNMNIDDTVSENIPEEVTEDYQTIEVSQEDIREEMLRYGAVPTEETQDSAESCEEECGKKCPIQKPIIIALIAVLVTAALVCGTLLVYNAFFKPGISGAWVPADSPDAGTYFVFDRDGNISMDGGNICYFGTYTMDKNDAGENVMKTDFYLFSYYGGEATISYSEDKNTMTLSFAAGDITFNKAELPELEIDPENITHASADEYGITTRTVDNGIIGSWSEELYGTYTFNEDGTGSYYSEYSYSDYYGYGYGVTYDFKYTVYEDKILITIDYHAGVSEDGTIGYYLDGDSLVLDGMGFTKVTE